MRFVTYLLINLKRGFLNRKSKSPVFLKRKSHATRKMTPPESREAWDDCRAKHELFHVDLCGRWVWRLEIVGCRAKHEPIIVKGVTVYLDGRFTIPT